MLFSTLIADWFWRSMSLWTPSQYIFTWLIMDSWFLAKPQSCASSFACAQMKAFATAWSPTACACARAVRSAVVMPLKSGRPAARPSTVETSGTRVQSGTGAAPCAMPSTVRGALNCLRSPMRSLPVLRSPVMSIPSLLRN